MSARRRKPEASWDSKDETMSPSEISRKIPWHEEDRHSSFRGGRSPRWSNLEGNDDFSSWEPVQGSRNMPNDGDIIRDRRTMRTEPAFDKRDNQYSTHTSDDHYGPPYRARDRDRDRGVGGRVSMSRDRYRDRSHSRSRSRSRSRGRGSARSRSRSRSRGMDQGRAWGSSSTRSRSPFCDNRRESYEHTNVRNDSRVSSRLCKDFMNGRCHRGASCRFPHHAASGDDHPRGNRNAHHDQDRRRHSDRNSRAPCRFFAAGKCSRDDCRFSHDVPESGYHDDNVRGHSLGNRSRAWNDRHPQDDLNAPDFSGFAKSNHNFVDKNKSWNGPTWAEVESGGPDDKKKSWNAPTWANVESGDFNDKKKSWNGPTWADVESGDFDNKKSWNGPTWAEVESGDFNDKKSWNVSTCAEVESGDFDNQKKSRNSSALAEAESGDFDAQKKSWTSSTRATVEAGNFNDSWKGPTWTNAESGDLDDKKKSWNGSTRNDVETGVFNETSHDIVLARSSGDKDRTRDDPSPLDAARSKHDSGDMRKENVIIVLDDSDTSNADMVSEDANQRIPTSRQDSAMSIRNTASQAPPTSNGPEKTHHMLSRTQPNGPEQTHHMLSGTQPNGHVQAMFVHRDANTPTHKASGAISEPVPAPLLQVPQKVTLPQPYTELNLTNALDLLYSLPRFVSSAPHHTRPEDQHAPPRNMEATEPVAITQYEPARNMEAATEAIKTNVFSGSLSQENQRFSPISTGVPNISKLQETGTNLTTKKQEPVGNPKPHHDNIGPGNSEVQGKVKEGELNDEEKSMRQFKIALVEFVKEILKPTWKEGKMSREVHKTVVKKVVDKVTGAIQGGQIPTTQAKIDHYLAFSKSKITKLVEAYLERFLKA